MTAARAAVLLMSAASVGLVVLGCTVALGNADASHRALDLPFWSSTLGALLGGPVFSTVGAVIVFRYPRHRIGWIMAMLGLSWGLSVVATDYERYALITHPGSLPGGSAAASVSIWMVSVNILLFFCLVMLFPTGRVEGIWNVLFWVGTAILTVSIVGAMLTPGPSNVSGIANPIGVLTVPQAVITVLTVASIGTFPVAAASVLHRFRTSRGVERQQMKWFAYGAAVAMILLLVAFVAGWQGIVITLNAAALTLLPVTIGAAILRYHLYDIDLIINRTLVYGSLTVSLVLMYTGAVLGLEALFRALTGQHSNLAVAIATLVVAALFSPWRSRVQAFIDRRFYRQRFDAARTLRAFSDRLRDEIDIDQLAGDLTGVLQETVEPASISLWLRDTEGSLV